MNFDYCFSYWRTKARKKINTLAENTLSSLWTPPLIPPGHPFPSPLVERSHWGSYSVAPVWRPPLTAVIPPSWLPHGPCLGSNLLLPCLGLLPCSGLRVLLQHFCCFLPSNIYFFLLTPAWTLWLMPSPFLSVPPALVSPLCLLLYVLLSHHLFSLFQLWCFFSLYFHPFLNTFLQRLQKKVCLDQLQCMVNVFCPLWSQLKLLCPAQVSS